MIIVHANDPTTKFLSLLYEQREDITKHITDKSTNSDILRILREDEPIMMLGHGNSYGLFSTPGRNGQYERFLITDRHVQFLRDKTCIGIWCYANLFAERYGLHGHFSGMIISDMQEAIDLHIPTTQEEVDRESVKFASRLQMCINHYHLREIPQKMKEQDDVRSELTRFNYSNLFYYE